MTTNNTQREFAQADIDVFLNISAWLTGYDQTRLQATGLTLTYLQTLTTNMPSETLKLFTKQAIEILLLSEKDPQLALSQTRSKLMPQSSYSACAQKIILMWYSGQWFTDPSDFQAQAAQITPQSYVQSLVWPTAEVHPPGAKQPGYGSWAYPPINISSASTSS